MEGRSAENKRVTVDMVSSFGSIEGVTRYRALDENGDLIQGPTIAIVGGVHGNEPVGWDLIQLLGKQVPSCLRRGVLLTVEANPQAHREGGRHTHGGIDLNRLWGATALQEVIAKDEEARCYEERRALELSPILEPVDFILDCHSTTSPSPPFLVFRDDQAHALIGSQLGVSYMVTGLHEGTVLRGEMCPDVGLRPAGRSARVGFTYEAGQHDDPTNVTRAYQIFVRILNIYGMWSEKAQPVPVDFEHQVFEVMNSFRQTAEGADSWRFVGHRGGEPGFGRSGAPRDLGSFEAVESGELVMRRGKAGVYRAQSAFTILLPTPNAEAGADLFYVAQRRHGGIIFGEPERTDAEARREALAVERMLDNLDDDGFERGETWASFDTRAVLDQCADMAARTLRLPAGHHNRCVTIVGRGDWGTGEKVKRVGRRYRQVMIDIVKRGVQVQRYQLLRGATLSWFGGLTSRAMSDAFESDGIESGSALFLSMRQPHTLSLFIVGDVERALASGDARGVRVAVLVEAATVEPSGQQVNVNVARMAIFSSRPEVLAMTSHLLTELRLEHKTILGRRAVVSDIGKELRYDHQCGILPWYAESERRALRGFLYRTQTERFTQLLADIPKHLSASINRGEWMARAMVESGIMDVLTIDRATVDSETGFTIDLNALMPVRRIRGAGSRSGESDPIEPVHGNEVNADNLQRWLGWKRFVRSSQVIPDSRGSDVDLAFSEGVVCNKLAHWFDDACSSAVEAPGDTLVIVASDGNLPAETGHASGVRLHQAHKALLEDTNVSYLRLQHAQGTKDLWMRDFLEALRARPAGGAPVSFAWELQHGMSMSIFVVATREDAGETSKRHLDEWDFRRCGILLSPTKGSSNVAHRIGMFTEVLPRKGRKRNHELLYFVRKHVEGLLAQAVVCQSNVSSEVLEEKIFERTVPVFSGWVRQVRQSMVRFLSGTEPNAEWVADTLGIVDPYVAGVLASVASQDMDEIAAAQEVWNQTFGKSAD